MTRDIKISVIVPAFNAAKYIRQAVESALMQPETAEVLIVEDCSPDRTLEVAEELAEQYPLVKLFRHEDGGNHGAAVSRNLGIKKSTHAVVAFLDADDYYLPGRFSTAAQILLKQPHVDGVYESIGTCFENTTVEKKWLRPLITGVKEKVASEDLYEALMDSGKFGWIHLDGLTVRRSLFEKAGCFDEQLRIRQDTALHIKMSLAGRLVAGRSHGEIVSVRRVHDENRFSNATKTTWNYYSELLFAALLQWCGSHGVSLKRQRPLLRKYLEFGHRNRSLNLQDKHFIFKRLGYLQFLIEAVLRYPLVLFVSEFWYQLSQTLGGGQIRSRFSLFKAIAKNKLKQPNN